AFALEEDRLAAVAGFSPRHRARVLAAVEARLREGTGVLLATAVATTRAIDALLSAAGAAEIVPVGETRRGVEIVHDLVVLVRGIDPARVAPVLDSAATLDGAHATAAADGATLVVHRLPTRVRVVPEPDWVHALLTETGDDAHLAWLEARAAPDLRTVCREQPSEADVYRALGLTPVPPELREGEGDRVPRGLVEPADVRGFFHVHTDWSDGTAPILAMASAAARSGYRYIGISDHSRAASYANGLDPARLSEQAKAIAIARREQSNCRILHGIEVDILPDGALDLPDDDLASLDFVIASVHVKLTMSDEEMTARLVRAVSHPLVTILGHPTGRLLLGRRGYAFDLGAVARAAAANDTYLEINANAQRLDLNEEHVRRAAREGARFAIDPDAHADHAVHDTALGVMIARRAGLTRDQVLNARDGDEIESVLAARKVRAIARLESAARGL
ncbi:MAG TPA: PHP domain-containing protein, partial [Polyangiaceae bacterium]